MTYSYLVTNTGNVTLNPVVVTDPMAGLSAITCPATTLAPAATETCTRHLHHHPGRPRRRLINNTGTATGTPPTGPESPPPSTVTIPADQSPASAWSSRPTSASFDAAGTADHLQLPGHQHRQRHPEPGRGHRPDGRPVGHHLPGHLAGPDGTETCTATYTTTQADLDAGHDQQHRHRHRARRRAART